jgi:hypothetical protein
MECEVLFSRQIFLILGQCGIVMAALARLRGRMVCMAWTRVSYMGHCGR